MKYRLKYNKFTGLYKAEYQDNSYFGDDSWWQKDFAWIDCLGSYHQKSRLKSLKKARKVIEMMIEEEWRLRKSCIWEDAE